MALILLYFMIRIANVFHKMIDLARVMDHFRSSLIGMLLPKTAAIRRSAYGATLETM